MADVLFQWGKSKANAVLRLERIRTLGSKYRKAIIGSAAALTLFVAPFAVQAVTDSGDQTDQTSAPNNTESQARPPEPTSESENKHDVKGQSTSTVDVQSNSSSSGNGNTEVDVTINGQKVPVPKNGQVHKTITENGNQTTVDIQVDNEANSTNVNSSSTSIEVDSSSTNSDLRSRRPSPR
jgi:hypothetical protein